jgi:hypothetical protein
MEITNSCSMELSKRCQILSFSLPGIRIQIFFDRCAWEIPNLELSNLSPYTPLID